MRHALLICAIVLTGCAPKPVDVAEAMIEAACDKDVARFFAHVERAEFAEHNVRREVARAKDTPAYLQFTEEVRTEGLKVLEATVKESVAKSLKEWEAEIEKGPSGAWCRVSILRSREFAKGGEVDLRTASGNLRTMVFSKFGEKWLLVKMESTEEASAAAK